MHKIMNFTKQSCTVVNSTDLFNLYARQLERHVELCGKNAYKSEGNIDLNSSRKFVNMIIDKKHFSVLEHGAVYFVISNMNLKEFPEYWKVINNPHSRYRHQKSGNNKINNYYVYTNLRVIAEELGTEVVRDYLNGIPLDGTNVFDPEPKDPYRRITFRMITDRGIMGEITRHRYMSFTIESTRYVNYGRKGTTFINSKEFFHTKYAWWIYKLSCKFSSFFYNALLKFGESPQIARSALNLGTKSDIIISGYIEDYNYIIGLREANSAHPMIRPFANKFKTVIKSL